MRGDYKKYLLWKPTTTLQQLVDAGRQIDASNFSLYNKMFGSEKSPNVVNEIKSSKPDSKSPRQKTIRVTLTLSVSLIFRRWGF